MIDGIAAGFARAVALVVAGASVGLGCNALRTEGRIELGRQYFVDIDAPPPIEGGDTGEMPPVSRLDGFVVATVDDAVALLAEAEEMPGVVVFVDARGDEYYRTGHLPGALRVDYYNAPRDLQQSLSVIATADKVVVYCSSNECDDALLLCRELRDTYAIPADRLVLFADGMRGWEERGLRIERAQ